MKILTYDEIDLLVETDTLALRDLAQDLTYGIKSMKVIAARDLPVEEKMRHIQQWLDQYTYGPR